MFPSRFHYVGLINSQYSRDQSKCGSGYVKHLDEPVGIRGSMKFLEEVFFNFLFRVDLNNPTHCDRLRNGLPAAIIGLRSARQFHQQELDSFDHPTTLTMADEMRLKTIGRPNLVSRIEVISILFDRLQKIQEALNAGLTLHEACKAYKIVENENSVCSTYPEIFEYENSELFVENQLEINKIHSE